MATVFDLFKEVEMNYLTISRGDVYGSIVESSKPINGIFKLRLGEVQTSNMENLTATATAHVHPEDFENADGIVGNGIRYNGTDYTITAVTAGTDFSRGVIEHLTLSLEVAVYVSESE